MSSTSEKTIRVRSIPQHNADEAFKHFTQRLTSAFPRKHHVFLSKTSHASIDVTLLTSLALQNDEKVGTISFPSRGLKDKALRDGGGAWHLDDKFAGITV